jgi:hypothetical protein
MLCFFNWTDAPLTLTAKLARASRVTDFWTGVTVAAARDAVTIADMPPHSARLLECADA